MSHPTRQTDVRSRFNALVERNETPWELTMAALAVMYVAVGFVSDEATGELASRVAFADAALTAVFVAEFASRFLASYDRRRYLRQHWIDLVALIPVARGARIFRLLRLLRLIRAFAGVYRAVVHVERLAQHRGFATLIVAWLGVMVLSSAGLYLAERGVNENIETPFDALWWGVVTLTTVGYGDVFPVTPEGRLAGMLLMLLGITMFAAITATLTSFLLADRSTPAPLPAVADPREEQVVSIIRLRDAGVLTDEEARRAFARLTTGEGE